MQSLLAILILALTPLHFVWAAAADCRDHYVAATHVVLATAAPGGNFSEAPTVLSDFTAAVAVAPRASIIDDWDWEYFDDDAPDIVEKLSALDLRDIDLDKLSCSLSTHHKPVPAGALDPHEFDLPNLGLVHVSVGHQRHVWSYQPALVPAPVFRTYRPPMTTL